MTQHIKTCTMKSKSVILACLLLGFINFSVTCQEDMKSRYQQKIEHYTRLRSAGSTMAIIGIGATIGGTVMLVDGASKYNKAYDPYYSSSTTTGEMEMYGGAIIMELGLDAIIGGIVLNSIGKHNIRKYNAKMQQLSLGINCRPNNKGLTLVYRF
jgi:hypothetical protein